MSRALAVAAVCFLLFAGVFSPLEGQTCPTGVIRNLRIVPSPLGTFGLAWDPVSIPNVTYEVMGATSASYCTLGGQPVSVIGRTAQPTFSAPLASGETAYLFYVRVGECPKIESDLVYVTDTFRNPPPKPAITAFRPGQARSR